MPTQVLDKRHGKLVASEFVDSLLTSGLLFMGFFFFADLRILHAKFHPHYQDVLVTLSSDKNLGWHEFKLQTSG